MLNIGSGLALLQAMLLVKDKADLYFSLGLVNLTSLFVTEHNQSEYYMHICRVR